MRVLVMVVVAGALLAGAGWRLTAGHAQGAEAVVRAVPVSSSVPTSSGQVDVAITVQHATDLAGFQFVLAFDPAVLKATSVQKTQFLSQSGRDMYCPEPTISDGAVRLACTTLRQTPAAVTGDGTIAKVTLKLLAPGTSDLVLKNVKLVHIDGGELPSTVANGRVQVTGGSWWTGLHLLLVIGGGVLAVLVLAGAAATIRARAAAGRPAGAGAPGKSA